MSGHTDFEGLSVQLRDDGVGVVKFNRPERLNAVTAQSFADLETALRRFGKDDACGAVVLCGEGAAFCAGHGHGGPPAEAGRRPGGGSRTTACGARSQPSWRCGTFRDRSSPRCRARRWEPDSRSPRHPTSGSARPDVKFIAPFLKLGVSIGDLGLSWTPPRPIGAGAAAEILYTGRILGADESRQLGLAQHVVDEPLAEAIDVAAEIAARPRLAVQMSKELLNASIGAGGLREHLELELRSQVIGLVSGDHRAAVAQVPGRQGPTVSRRGPFMAEIRFDNQVAVVTGAGGGLGKTYALELARRGAAVVVNDLGGVDGTRLGSGPADKWSRGDQQGRRPGGRVGDSVATPEGGGRIIEGGRSTFGRSTSSSTTPASCATSRSPSCRASRPRGRARRPPARRVQRVAAGVPGDEGQKYGRFLFTSSAAGIFGNFGQANYGAAKMGLVGLSNVLAVEGARAMDQVERDRADRADPDDRAAARPAGRS